MLSRASSKAVYSIHAPSPIDFEFRRTFSGIPVVTTNNTTSHGTRFHRIHGARHFFHVRGALTAHTSDRGHYDLRASRPSGLNARKLSSCRINRNSFSQDGSNAVVNVQRHPTVFSFCDAGKWRDLDLQKAQNAPGVRMLHRKVLVTGGSSGIGLATAKRLVLEGASSIAIVSRSGDNAQRALDVIREETRLIDAPVWGLVGDIQDHKKLLAAVSNPAEKGVLVSFNPLTDVSDSLAVKWAY